MRRSKTKENKQEQEEYLRLLDIMSKESYLLQGTIDKQ